MRKLSILTLCSLVLWACNNTTNSTDGKVAEAEEPTETTQPERQYYGDSITPQNPVEAADLMAMLEGQDSVKVQVSGTVNSSCKKKGCWMKVDLGNDQEMHVSFKDYGFFVPKNLNGEHAIMEGYASLDTMDVDYLRHLAHDAGKSEEEIEAITEPKVSLTYVATGVIIEKDGKAKL